jgi:MoxR-like ATPase
VAQATFHPSPACVDRGIAKMPQRFESPEQVRQVLGQQEYIAGEEIATVVFLAQELGKPILAEGPAGVGKTELAKALAGALQRELIRLQCYEGLDETKALYEWEYAKQLLYTQLLRDKVQASLRRTRTLGEAADRLSREEDVFFSMLPSSAAVATRHPLPAGSCCWWMRSIALTPSSKPSCWRS